MSKLFSLFKHKEFYPLPEFSERVATLRPRLGSMGAQKRVEALIDVSKVWTYDYDERKEFMQELFNLLPKEIQSSLTEFLTKCIPSRDITQDIPLALSQVKKEKLAEFVTLIA
jgi:hypothetical protein